jgi:hypothetical protein
MVVIKNLGTVTSDYQLWEILIIRDAPDTVFAGYPAGRISG